MGGDLIQIGPAEVWSAPVSIPAATDSFIPTVVAPVGAAPPAAWMPFSNRLMKETATIMIDRGLTMFTPAGASMPTRTYAKKLEVKVGFTKVEVPLDEIAFAAGYLGGSSAMDASGVQAVGLPYERATAAADASLELLPGNYEIEREGDANNPVTAEGYRSLIIRGPSPLKAGKVLQLYIPFARHLGGVEIGPGSDEPMGIKFDFMSFDLDGGVSAIELVHGIA